jgi:hypothetical protein
MQPIHLAIGIVEGFVTAGVILFVLKARPEVLEAAGDRTRLRGVSLRTVLAGLAAAAVLTGGVLSWFASAYPDGLEWSIAKTTGSEELASPERVFIPPLPASRRKRRSCPITVSGPEAGTTGPRRRRKRLPGRIPTWERLSRALRAVP